MCFRRGGKIPPRERASVARAVTPRMPKRTNAPYSRIASDRKSTRLNSSHSQISYAVFCLKKKKKPADDRATRAEQPALPHVPDQIPDLPHTYPAKIRPTQLDTLVDHADAPLTIAAGHIVS